MQGLKPADMDMVRQRTGTGSPFFSQLIRIRKGTLWVSEGLKEGRGQANRAVGCNPGDVRARDLAAWPTTSTDRPHGWVRCPWQGTAYGLQPGLSGTTTGM